MAVYTQRHQIEAAIGKVSAGKLQAMVDDCRAGEMAQAAEQEEQFDEQKFQEWLATSMFKALNKNVQSYIYSKYDQGTQASFLSLHNDPSTPQSAKDDIEMVWQWTRSVMGYYYQRKTEILNNQVIDWDFAAEFDSADPDIKLQDLI